jgi:branched-chain amino acid transport system permease protein
MIEGTLPRMLIDICMFFGLFVIVAMALNFQYGNAGVPNLGSAMSVAFGGYLVTGVIVRILYLAAAAGGATLLPWTDNWGWLYNNYGNTNTVNLFMVDHPMLGISVFLLSIGLGFVFGWAMGYVVSLPAIKLGSTYLMITLITMADIIQLIGINFVPLSGTTLGTWVPDPFEFYLGDRSLVLSLVTMVFGLICYLVLRTMLNSPYGRLMRAVRENDTTVSSVGKNVTGIRRNVLMFASGITAVTGVLVCWYYAFGVGQSYARATWTYWPWLMLMLGGPGNNAGTFVGAALVIFMRRLIVIYKFQLDKFIWFPMVFFENILLGILLVVTMVFRPDGLIPEKLLRIPGINYRRLVRETTRVDWRATQSQSGGATKKTGGLLGRFRGKKQVKEEEGE